MIDHPSVGPRNVTERLNLLRRIQDNWENARWEVQASYPEAPTTRPIVYTNGLLGIDRSTWEGGYLVKGLSLLRVFPTPTSPEEDSWAVDIHEGCLNGTTEVDVGQDLIIHAWCVTYWFTPG